MKNTCILVFLVLLNFSLINTCYASTNVADGNYFSEDESPFDQEPVKMVMDFLNWYKNNYSSLSKIELVNMQENESYSVNIKGTEEYLTEIKKSGYISDKYLEKWRNYFRMCQDSFIENPQNDGPPAGFEFDFVLWTQEIDETMISISNPELIKYSIDCNTSKVVINVMMHLTFKLSKIQDKWMIDEIENSSEEISPDTKDNDEFYDTYTGLDFINDCVRSIPSPVLNRERFSCSNFEFDNYVSFETIDLNESERLIIKNTGCETYTLVFRFNIPGKYSESKNSVLWYNKLLDLLKTIENDVINSPIDLKSACIKLKEYINNNKQLRIPGDDIAIIEGEIPQMMRFDKITDTGYDRVFLDLSIWIGPL